MKMYSVMFAVLTIISCASKPVVPPPSDMQHEPIGSPGYNCYYNQRCPNYTWGAAADAQHNANYAATTCVSGECLNNLQNLCYQEKVPGKCFEYGQIREKNNDPLPLVVQVYRQACSDNDQRGCDAVNRLQPTFSSDPSCVDIKTLPYSIVQKIDDHHYELVAETNDPGALHMMLETKKAVYTSTGHPTGIGVKNGFESRHVRLKDGFEGHTGVFKECAIVPYTSNVRLPGLAYRKNIDEH